MTDDSIEISVAVTAWFYPTADAVKADKERATQQFMGRAFGVFGGLSEDTPGGFVAFVGPPAELDKAEAQWTPGGGAERGSPRSDIAHALASRWLTEAGGIVLDGEGGYKRIELPKEES